MTPLKTMLPSRMMFSNPLRETLRVHLRRISNALIVPVILIVVWEYVSRSGYLPPGSLPRPSDVALNMYEWIFGTSSKTLAIYSGSWLSNVLFSTRRVLTGFFIAAGLGIALGLWVAVSRLGEELLDPIVHVIRPIPVVAWLPFAMVLFGIKDAAAFFLIALGAFFPVFLNTAHGARDTRKTLVRAAQMLGTSNRQMIYRVVIPSALPSIITGLRLGIGMAWVGVVVSEMLAVKSGLGFVLWDAYYLAQTDILIGTMITLGLLGFACDRIVLLSSARVLRWKTMEHLRA